MPVRLVERARDVSAAFGADLRLLAPVRAVPRRVSWSHAVSDVVAGFGVAVVGLMVVSTVWWPWW